MLARSLSLHLSVSLSFSLIQMRLHSLSSRSTTTGTWGTWLSMCCRPGTWPRGTTTVTLTLLSRFTSYLDEGELPLFLARASRISALCLPFCFCVCLVVYSLFSFWPCLHGAVLELTNWFCLYERMRMDTMTWGSHTGPPSIHPKTLHSLALRSGVFWSPLLISLYRLHTRQIDAHLAAL